MGQNSFIFIVLLSQLIAISSFIFPNKQTKFTVFKGKFKLNGNCCKSIIEAISLVYVNITREFITSQKIGFHEFLQTDNSTISKAKSGTPSISFVFVSKKEKWFAHICSGNANLDNLVIHLTNFLFRRNLK